MRKKRARQTKNSRIPFPKQRKERKKTFANFFIELMKN